MRIVSNNEIWKGFFSYEDEYSSLASFREVEFEINIFVNNHSFEGTAHDEESKKYFDEPVKVKGVFENNFISFVMKYPYTYFLNENDEIVVDKQVSHPDVNYYGEFDMHSKTYKGQWEITYIVEQFIDGDVEEIYSGNWELKKH
ncbi:hypothetical protein BFR04_09690 [Gaetbulibacter sp. 4G1]|nr:hypothetical protein [Gaetbulibacter sp. 4G1]PIA77698.1 hypothetical protein BFR04_09690 [Gaetbulibacter sp. 4G1]